MSENTDNKCCICGHVSQNPEQTSIRSNVRKFRNEIFELWRCEKCRSIHSKSDVNLDYYYSYYPFFKQTLDGILKMSYRRLTHRLKRAGMSRTWKILDYGCGSGLLMEYMRTDGYDAVGYDRYSADHSDPIILNRQYDLVVAQDVIEHAADPLEILRQLDSLVRPGGQIAIGTPNAAGIDLKNPEKFVHPLHQPYHRHIFAIDTLIQCAADLGWSLQAYYPTPYTNMPLLSLPFLHHYMKQYDGCIDMLFEPNKKIGRLLYHPGTLFWLLAGYFLCNDADIVAIFHKR
ncbi:MAG TPA: class I SAM-dependent methyltransferase [Phycisphaerae bacterium]|nr:class I SAM-dependent methyltransferase [Phycisphaerae bacterium]